MVEYNIDDNTLVVYLNEQNLEVDSILVRMYNFCFFYQSIKVFLNIKKPTCTVLENHLLENHLLENLLNCKNNLITN